MAINRKKKLTKQHKRQRKEELPDNVKQLNNFLEDTIFAPLISLLEKKSNLKAKDEIEVMNLSAHPAISNALTAYRLLDKGVHFLEDGMYDEAVNSLNDSVKFMPDAPYTHFTLARAYELMGRENEAIREFSEFVRLAPLNPGGYYFLGSLLMRQRRYKEAVSRFREVIQLYDKFENTKLEADDEFTAIVLKDEAKKLIYRYSEIFGNYAEGLLCLSNGEYEEAERYFLHSNNIIQEGKISELSYFLILAKIPKIDEKIRKLRDSQNFAELRKLAKSLSIEIWRILKKTNAETQPFYPLILCKFIYVTFLLDCLLPGFKQNFIKQLSKSGFPEEGIKETEKLLFDSESAAKFMKEVKLVDAKQFLNSLDTFSTEVKKYPSPDDMPLQKQRLLIKSLVPLSNAVDGQSTESATAQILLSGQDEIKKQITGLISKVEKIEKRKSKLAVDERVSLYFTTDYEVIIKPGPKRKGLLIVNNIPIQISPIESDLCVVMAKQLKDDWQYISERDPLEVGWVSFEEFENTISQWIILKKKKDVVPDPLIINAINRLNKKIRNTLRFKKKYMDLIESGWKYGRAREYRFRVYPKMITIE